MTMADRIVDRLARRPHGVIGRLLYRHAPGHGYGFDVALRESAPVRGERIAEIGCGGGLVLERILAAGAEAVGIDHSPDMLETSRARNRRAVVAGRLRLVEADAGSLPLPDKEFDRLYCLNAFFFFPEPEAALAEMARITKSGATLAILTASPELAPKIGRFFRPMAKAMRFHASDTMRLWLHRAGFDVLRVIDVKGAGYLILARKCEAE